MSTSYWAADESRPVLEMTVGDLLRDAAAAAPDAIALVEGTPDPESRRRWTYAGLLAEAERAARALLGRFEPGERVAVWANNIPEWVLLEHAAALAGITIVTVNPALRAEELTHVLGQSGASGVFLVPDYRGTMMAQLLAEVRGELPALREVVSFAAWEEFTAAGPEVGELPGVRPADPAQVQYTSGTTGVPEGRGAASPGHRQQCPLLHRPRRHARRVRLPEPHAVVPYGRLRDGRARRARRPGDAGAAALLRPRPDARADGVGAPAVHGRHADHADRHARSSGDGDGRRVVGPPADLRRGRRPARAGAAGGRGVRRPAVRDLRADRGIALHHLHLAGRRTGRPARDAGATASVHRGEDRRRGDRRSRSRPASSARSAPAATTS